eukprot:2788060-Rhodomonas_salina.2
MIDLVAPASNKHRIKRVSMTDLVEVDEVVAVRAQLLVAPYTRSVPDIAYAWADRGKSGQYWTSHSAIRVG